MQKQNIKEKNLFNLCTGLKFQKMRDGDYAVIHGDNNESSRKLMILIDGIVSVETPIHPQTMLAKVRDMIYHIDQPADLINSLNNSQECVI
jgi:hypothetical protein